MKKLKRILRIVGLVLLVMLACTGIGLTGAAPISSSNRQVLPEEVNVEMVEKEEEGETDEMQELIS